MIVVRPLWLYLRTEDDLLYRFSLVRTGSHVVLLYLFRHRTKSRNRLQSCRNLLNLLVRTKHSHSSIPACMHWMDGFYEQ